MRILAGLESFADRSFYGVSDEDYGSRTFTIFVYTCLPIMYKGGNMMEKIKVDDDKEEKNIGELEIDDEEMAG